MRLVLFFLLVLSVLCMSQTIEQKCIEKPIYELSENGKGKIVGSIEVKERERNSDSCRCLRLEAGTIWFSYA